jgi:hypothetical protein
MRLRWFQRKHEFEQGMNEEMRFHIEKQTEKNVAAGMRPEEARRQAVLQFGGVEGAREDCREERRGFWLETVWSNIRYGLRMMRRDPGFTIVVVLTLALSIGANSAVFSAIDAILLRPLPFPDGDQLMRLSQQNPKVKNPQTFVAPVRLEDWNRMNSTFRAITGYYLEDASETSSALPEKLTQALVAPRFLQVWGIAPALGRDFTPEEERFGGPGAALISDRFWRRRFHGDPNTPGKKLLIGKWSYTIVGVMPASFLFPVRDVDFWSPSAPDAPFAQSRESTWFTVIGRVKPGVTLNIFKSLAQSCGTQVSTRNRLQWLLVGVQVALAVTLLAGAGLLLRSFQALGRVSPGFEPSHVLTFHLSASWGETVDLKRLERRIDGVIDFLSNVPGVEAAATSAALPGVPSEYQTEFKFAEGQVDPDRKIVAESRFVSAGYFATMQIPLLSGEPCREEPSGIDVLVNRSFANTYLAGSSAIGRHLQVLGQTFVPTGQIRGIVGDAREEGLNREPGPVAYWCTSAPLPDPFYLVRTRTEPMALAETIRKRLHEIEPARSVFGMAPLEEHLDEAFAESRLRMVLLGFFAATAVSLACVGLYGTLSYSVTARQREVGLRLALGALRGQIVKKFLFQGLGATLAGCVAGCAMAMVFARVMSGMLYGVSPTDVATLSAVVFVVLLVATLASLIPAIRAARVEPMRVLRNE